MSLSVVEKILKDLENESGRKAKEEIIKEVLGTGVGIDLERVVYYAYNPFLKYNITEVKFVSSNGSSINKAFDFLEYLSKKRGCSDLEAKELFELCSVDEETVSVFNI